MSETEILYPYSSVLIASVLFLVIVLFNEVGFRIGRFVQEHTDSEIKALTGSIQASILGLLALLLGFTFSMAMQRYDSRSMALIDEANALGTALLKVQLLPPQEQPEARELLHRYIDLRIETGSIDITRHEERERHNHQTAELQDQLWALAVRATNQDPRAVTSGAFVKSLNDVIDAGILGEPLGIVPDIDHAEAARAGGTTIEALQKAGFQDVFAHVMKGTGHGIAPDGLGVALAFMRDKLGL